MKLPVDVVTKSFQEVLTVVKKTVDTLQLVFGLGFHSHAMETSTTKR